MGESERAKNNRRNAINDDLHNLDLLLVISSIEWLNGNHSTKCHISSD